MATWPPGLPQGWLVGTPININTGVNATAMLSGSVRQRQVMALPFDTYNVRFSFDNTEFRVFEYFVRDVINSVDWFTGPYHDGSGPQTGTVRFANGGSYNASQDTETDQWIVSAMLEVDGRK